ncbi:hypothetical protein GEMRC1_012145 [Eukaryota sp. GEM-RC1]
MDATQLIRKITLPGILPGWSCCKPKPSLHEITFIARLGFSTLTLAYMLDSLVRVSRRDSWTLYIGVSAEAVYLPPEECQCQGYNTTNNRSHQWLPSLTHSNSQRHSIPTTEAVYCGGQPLILLVISGTFNSLQSSFHLSLTVLVNYRSPTIFSFTGILPAFNAAFPNSATLGTPTVIQSFDVMYGIFTLHDTLFQGFVHRGPNAGVLRPHVVTAKGHEDLVLSFFLFVRHY